MEINKFISNMFANINTATYYPIKRSFGKTLETCPIDALLAFTKMSQDANSSMNVRNAEFLVAGLCYNTIRQYSNEERTLVPFEAVLRRLYNNPNTTDSMKSSIESFLSLSITDNGYFQDKFVTLSKKVIPYLSANEMFNFTSLLNDLIKWNDGNLIRLKWAKALVQFEN